MSVVVFGAAYTCVIMWHRTLLLVIAYVGGHGPKFALAARSRPISQAVATQPGLEEALGARGHLVDLADRVSESHLRVHVSGRAPEHVGERRIGTAAREKDSRHTHTHTHAQDRALRDGRATHPLPQSALR